MRRALMGTRLASLRSLSLIVPQVASANLGVSEADAPDRAEENVGERGEPQPELIGAHGGGRGPVGEQVALAQLEQFGGGFHVFAQGGVSEIK